MQLPISLMIIISLVAAIGAVTLGVLSMKRRDKGGASSNITSEGVYSEGFDGSDLGSPHWFGDGGWDSGDGGDGGSGDGGGD
jgi:hypothetical protein